MDAKLFSLKGRTAFITGAGRGLGEAMARAFHAAGANVALSDLSDSVRAVATSLDPKGQTATAEVMDVRDLGAMQRTFDAAVAKFGGVDILVNNAARTAQKPLMDIDPAEWDDVQAINLRSVFFACQMAARHMKGRGWGRIINNASIAGQIGGLVAGAHYASSKAGVLLITRMWAAELAPHGITVNALAPAAVKGPIMDSVPKERIEALAKSVPVGRLGEPEDVAAAALYLASDASGYMTGATLDLNGGRYMRQ